MTSAYSSPPHGGSRAARRGGGRVAALLACGAVALVRPAAAPAQAIGQLVYGQLLASEIPLTTTTGRNQGVRQRQRAELIQQGLPVGSFRLYPSVLGGVGYTSNVVGAETGKRSDGYVEVRPAASLESQWSRNALRANVYYDGLRYFRTGAKDQDGFQAQVEGRLDILEQDSVTAGGGFRRYYEDQQEASFPLGGGGAVAVDQPTAQVRGTYVANRARITGSADYTGFAYRDTVSTNGTRIDLSFRDRNVLRGSTRVEYLLGQEDSVFGQATYRRTDYRTSDPLNDRTSNEWRIAAGVIADVTQLIRVAGAVGYFRRTYPTGNFDTFADIAADVRVDYYVTPLTTVTGIVSRQPEESPILGSPGFVQTRVGGRVDHELLRNLIPYLYANYATARFKGIDRDDRTVEGGGGADYYLSRRFSAGFEAAYVSRDSKGLARGPEINELRALVSLKYHP